MRSEKRNASLLTPYALRYDWKNRLNVFLSKLLQLLNQEAPLVVAALLLGLAPFYPEPHLLEKIKMLGAGTLSRPIDIFDLLMHGAPAVLLVLKLIRMRGTGNAA